MPDQQELDNAKVKKGADHVERICQNTQILIDHLPNWQTDYPKLGDCIAPDYLTKPQDLEAYAIKSAVFNAVAPKDLALVVEVIWSIEDAARCKARDGCLELAIAIIDEIEDGSNLTNVQINKLFRWLKGSDRAAELKMVNIDIEGCARVMVDGGLSAEQAVRAMFQL